jgi:hypothetical protein
MPERISRINEENRCAQICLAAAKEINNRFLLCRVASISARRLQINSKPSSETINQSLRLIAASAAETTLQGCESVESCQAEIPVLETQPLAESV